MREEDLIKLAQQINDQSLREKVIEIVRDPKLTCLETQNPNSTTFQKSPASKRRHHSYESGLIVHTYATTRMALAISDVVEEVYGM
ncbi:MAG: dihydroneopterin 2',3'-cyclic phosphate phosphodiesterase, partial [Candidatus Verstraetearchaeota archaeon]|nr:dihydroneopterin 2',3'-cyclic phosphate phosphodiesterase [Candidatus Verstraetearchaeota archaeon]